MPHDLRHPHDLWFINQRYPKILLIISIIIIMNIIIITIIIINIIIIIINPFALILEVPQIIKPMGTFIIRRYLIFGGEAGPNIKFKTLKQ